MWWMEFVSCIHCQFTWPKFIEIITSRTKIPNTVRSFYFFLKRQLHKDAACAHVNFAIIFVSFDWHANTTIHFHLHSNCAMPKVKIEVNMSCRRTNMMWWKTKLDAAYENEIFLVVEEVVVCSLDNRLHVVQRIFTIQNSLKCHEWNHFIMHCAQVHTRAKSNIGRCYWLAIKVNRVFS